MLVEFVLLVFSLVALYLIYTKGTAYYRTSYWGSRGLLYITKATSWADTLRFRFLTQHYYTQAKENNCGAIGVWEQGQPAVFLSDPELVKLVFVKDADHFVDRRDSPTGDPLLAKMLVSLHGQEWKEVRNFLTPTFTSGKIRRMFDLFNNSGKRLRSFVAAAPSSGEKAHIVTVPEFSRRFTVDVIGATVFGFETGALSEADSIFYRLATQSANPSKKQIAKFVFFFMLPKLAEKMGFKVFDTEVTSYFVGILENALATREKSGESRDFY